MLMSNVNYANLSQQPSLKSNYNIKIKMLMLLSMMQR